MSKTFVSSDSPSVTVGVSSDEVGVKAQSTASLLKTAASSSVGMSISSAADSVKLALNARGIEQAEKIARANRAIELGYMPAKRPTR